jgi:hypothetical protein
MGIIGATGGYIGGKIILGSFSLVMGIGAAGFGVVSLIFPRISTIASTTLSAAKRTAWMTITPFDKLSTNLAVTTGILTGPM